MAIEARCPHCESTIRASDKYAGQHVKCPKCGGVMQVPGAAATPQGIDPQPAAAPAATPSVAETGSVAEAGAGAPLLQVGADEHWRKAVVRRNAADRKPGGPPKWLLPVVGLAACVLVAGGVFAFTRPAGNVATHDAESTPVDVAQASPEAASPGATSSASDTATGNTAPSLHEQPSSDDSSNDPPSTGDAVATSPAGTADGTAGAEMTESPATAAAAAIADATPGNETSPSSPSTMKPGDSADGGPDSSALASTETAKPSGATPAQASPEKKTDPVVLKGPPEDVLKEHGVRIVGDQAALVDEGAADIRAGLRDAQKLRLSLVKAYAEANRLERLQKDLKTEYGNRNAALAQAAATGNVQANNLIVGQLETIKTKLEQVEEQVEASRAKLAVAREGYIDHLLKTREIFKGVEQHYADAAADPQIQTALASLSKDGNELKLEPLGSFYRAQKELETLENQVLSDSIVARVEGGNLHVSTQINGEHTIEMVVDSGASVVTLPYQMAVDAGIKPKPTDPVAKFRIANGSVISGQMITIASLRVGKFTVENVEAAVLGPEAVNAEPLLGMSFLSKFEAKIDSERGQLILSRIEGTEGPDRIRGD